MRLTDHLDADLAEFFEVASDMSFENLLAAVRIDLQFGGDATLGEIVHANPLPKKGRAWRLRPPLP